MRDACASVIRRLGALTVAVGCIACESDPVAMVHLTSGVRPEERRSFQPKAALAEYNEIPGVGTEVTVVLSSHPISCDSYLPLGKDQVMVTLTFSAPQGARLGPGPYAWIGLKTGETPAAEPSVANEPATTQVMPFVRLGKQGQLLPPGGLVELTEVRLDAQGGVRGLLRLEQPGSVGLPATSLLGSFSARWCRISLASGSETL